MIVHIWEVDTEATRIDEVIYWELEIAIIT